LDFTVADEFEARLVAVNPLPALRKPTGGSVAGRAAKGEPSEKQMRRSALEKERRNIARYHAERIGRLFRATAKSWSKRDVLGLCELIFRIDGLD
jgi:hypothetical protein